MYRGDNKMLEINNRRYIGCKTKLLDKIYDSIIEMGYDNSNIFADVFAGTGVVANRFANNGFKTILNDTLFSNVVAYEAWLGDGQIDEQKINNLLNYFNNLDANELDNNYFSEIYAGKYFATNDAKKIGFIRDYLDTHKSELTKREFCILLTSLMYCADKIANTVGHFESFLNKIPEEKGVIMQQLKINSNLIPADIYELDANEFVRKVKCDIAYIDPPYNARQYINFYHVLENLARWKKPTEFEGNSMKFKRTELKSDYCRTNKATKLFEDLISHLDCKLIVVSYNNTYVANSISSINTISEDDLKAILRKKGKLHIKAIDYKFFNAGKTDFKNHKEFLYICEVGK